MKTTNVRAASAALALTCALALAGCSGGGDDPVASAKLTTTAADQGGPASGLPDACGLLTAADVSSVAGATYSDAKHNDDLSREWQDICEWWASDGSLAFVQTLVIAGPDQVASQRDSAQDVMGDVADVSVSGASNAYAAGSGSILGMAVGDYFVQVSYMTTSSDDVTAQTIALAEIVAGNV